MNDVQENIPKLRVLDPSEERFCELFAATRQCAYAFREVYDQAASHTTVAHHAAGQKLLADDAIKSFISELTAKLAMANYTTLQSCFEMWVNIASADPDELIGLRIGACRHCHGEGFKRQWKYTEYLEACDAAEAAHEALTEMQKAKFPLRCPTLPAARIMTTPVTLTPIARTVAAKALKEWWRATRPACRRRPVYYMVASK